MAKAPAPEKRRNYSGEGKEFGRIDPSELGLGFSFEHRENRSKICSNKMSQIGRNDKCPCGSGSKYKKCCEEKDKYNARTSFSILKRVYGADSSEDDFFHRFLFQMLQIRDHISPREEHLDHDESYSTIFQNLLEAKLARNHCLRVMKSHEENVATGVDARVVLPSQITILNAVEDDLGFYFKDFFIRGVSAIDRLFSHSKQMGYPISKLFEDDEKKRQEGVRQFPLDSNDPRFLRLMKFIEGHQKTWYRIFRYHRGQVIHRGWKLPDAKYIFVPGNKLQVVYPQVFGRKIDEVLDLCWNNMTNFCEELLIFIASLKLRPPLVILEIPKEKRDPNLRVRFVVRHPAFPDA